MKNDIKCFCGNLHKLAEDFIDGTLKDFEMSFYLKEDNGKFIIDFLNGFSFELSTCWICGGMELGEFESEEYKNRLMCNCELLSHWISDSNIPVVFIKEFNEIQLTAYDKEDGKFPLIMNFCPLCKGRLPQDN